MGTKYKEEFWGPPKGLLGPGLQAMPGLPNSTARLCMPISYTFPSLWLPDRSRGEQGTRSPQGRCPFGCNTLHEGARSNGP